MPTVAIRKHTTQINCVSVKLISRQIFECAHIQIWYFIFIQYLLIYVNIIGRVYETRSSAVAKF